MELKNIEEFAKEIYNKEKKNQLQYSNSILIDKLRNIYKLKEIITSGINMLGYSNKNYTTLKNIISNKNNPSSSRIFSITITTLSYQVNDKEISTPNHDVKSYIFVYNDPSGTQIDLKGDDESIFIYSFSNFNLFKLELINLLDTFNKKKNEIANIHTIINDDFHTYIQKIKKDSSWKVENIFNFINYCELKSKDEEDPPEIIELAA